MYDDRIMRAVRQNLGYTANDTSHDDVIAMMSKSEVFERFLTWEGIIGYADMILSVLHNIYGFDFEEIERSGNND